MQLVSVSKSYGKQKIFDNFSLDITSGEVLCVLGESGGGKTTLLNMLAGLIEYEGRIEEKPKKISYIFQEARLLPHLSVRQNLAYVGGRVEAIDILLKKTGLSELADKRANRLSGGEKQRVAIARAFLNSADLLLMDEPFSSLDTASKIRLAEAFAQLHGDETVVFVTHNIEEALMLADRVIVLKRGKIAADVRLTNAGGEEGTNGREIPRPYGRACAERDLLLSVLLEP